ncbi:hypothetical protein KCU95_g19626, partial [Aureobasidium melanogenum]
MDVQDDRSMNLPQSRAFITSLIQSLNTSPTTTATTPPANPLKHASPADRSVLLTLHVLFPNELLSALDLLDRELVVRLLPLSNTDATPPIPEQAGQQAKDTNTDQDVSTSPDDTNNDMKVDKDYRNAVYYVRSAQQTSSYSRFRDPVAASTHYEVRTSSWSCSCPAFAFSAFPANPPTDEEDGDDETATGEDKEQQWIVGGLSLGKDVPMCKHLLACVLAERGGLFEGYVKTRKVSVEELAGWAAGWGG